MSHNPATRQFHRKQVLVDAPEHAHHLQGDLYIEGPTVGADLRATSVSTSTGGWRTERLRRSNRSEWPGTLRD